jgi:predicted regulator of Ras-like GTPase activity (Roadblock/LC7/MglB family)
MSRYDDAALKLKDMLSRMVSSSGAMIALLVTREGTVLGEAGDTACMNTTAAAALVAGMYSATREVARMVGEQQFSILLQQGENRHVHISLVTDDSMLVVVFEDYQRIGRVRHEARKTSVAAAEVILASRGGSHEGQKLDAAEFKAYALNLVDRIFATK